MPNGLPSLSIGPVFSILGVVGGIFHFHFYSNSKRTYCTQTVEASGLVLRCLPMSHKKDTWLIWIKKTCTTRELRVIPWPVNRHVFKLPVVLLLVQ